MFDRLRRDLAQNPLHRHATSPGVSPIMRTMAKPDMVILYNCPIAKVPSRILYRADASGKEPHQVDVEQHGLDGIGQERWAPPAGAHMISWAILAAVLRQVAIGKVTPVKADDGSVTIDAREIVIVGPKAN